MSIDTHQFLTVFEACCWLLGGMAIGAIIVAAFATRPRGDG